MAKTKKTSKKYDVRLVNRLNKAEGQIRGIKKMVEEDKECYDVMVQVLSVSSSIKSIWEILAALYLKDNTGRCKDVETKRTSILKIIKHLKKLR